MRVIFAAIATVAAGGMASCSPPAPEMQQAAAPLTYEAPGRVTRTPLAPPAGYASTSAATASSDEAAQLGWHASPRWSVIQGNGMMTDYGFRSHIASKPTAAPDSAEDAPESGGGY
jgi:hypothetical protein